MGSFGRERAVHSRSAVEVAILGSDRCRRGREFRACDQPARILEASGPDGQLAFCARLRDDIPVGRRSFGNQCDGHQPEHGSDADRRRLSPLLHAARRTDRGYGGADSGAPSRRDRQPSRCYRRDRSRRFHQSGFSEGQPLRRRIYGSHQRCGRPHGFLGRGAWQEDRSDFRIQVPGGRHLLTGGAKLRLLRTDVRRHEWHQSRARGEIPRAADRSGGWAVAGKFRRPFRRVGGGRKVSGSGRAVFRQEQPAAGSG